MKWWVLIPILGVAYIAVSKKYLPRRIRNNIEWQGMQTIQNDSDFVQFDSPEYGFRAMARVLRSYASRGLNTLRSIISTYAPATENHTETYVHFVAAHLNVSPDAVLDVDSKLFELIQAISIFENGTLYANHYDDKTIKDGIALA
ncbi:hypothetical protein TDB9533_03005 [Thalassocella blandensis]|nr:hypothetical protein TDB9533_03005 [Thalassocella blandensis]